MMSHMINDTIVACSKDEGETTSLQTPSIIGQVSPNNLEQNEDIYMILFTVVVFMLILLIIVKERYLDFARNTLVKKVKESMGEKSGVVKSVGTVFSSCKTTVRRSMATTASPHKKQESHYRRVPHSRPFPLHNRRSFTLALVSVLCIAIISMTTGTTPDETDLLKTEPGRLVRSPATAAIWPVVSLDRCSSYDLHSEET